jgi:hypothetical protein
MEHLKESEMEIAQAKILGKIAVNRIAPTSTFVFNSTFDYATINRWTFVALSD